MGRGFVGFFFFRLLALKLRDKVTVSLGINFSLLQVMSDLGPGGSQPDGYSPTEQLSSPSLLLVGGECSFSSPEGGGGFFVPGVLRAA